MFDAVTAVLRAFTRMWDALVAGINRAYRRCTRD